MINLLIKSKRTYYLGLSNYLNNKTNCEANENLWLKNDFKIVLK